MKNKHKAHVAKARAAKEICLSRLGAPGINARAQVHSRTLFQPENYIFVNAPKYPNPKLEVGGGASAGPGDATEKCGNVYLDTPLGGGYAPQDRRGWVHASEITLSGVGSGSGRARMRGEHTVMRMRMRPGARRFHSRQSCGRARVSGITLSGACHCSGKGRVQQGNAQRHECMRSWVPSNAVPFCLLNDKSTSYIFWCSATRPDNRSISWCVPHLFLKQARATHNTCDR
jgi:hypothetical protein